MFTRSRFHILLQSLISTPSSEIRRIKSFCIILYIIAIWNFPSGFYGSSSNIDKLSVNHYYLISLSPPSPEKILTLLIVVPSKNSIANLMALAGPPLDGTQSTAHTSP